MLEKLKENRNVIDKLALLILTLILSLPLFNEKIDLYLDDGGQHLMRAYYTYQSILQKGNGKVLLDFVAGFGYSWDLFYGPLSTWLIILPAVFLGSFNVGFKVAIFLILYLAGITMYQFIQGMTENKNTACLASVIYMTSPYFFTDLYIRHAMRRKYGFYFSTDGIFRIVSFV